MFKDSSQQMIHLRTLYQKTYFLKKKPQEWESAIYKQHLTLKGKLTEEAKREYIDYVKQFKFYGTTFYPPCKTQNIRALPNKVIIGVNYEGIHIFRSKNKEHISSHFFTEISSWASGTGTFAFEFGNQHDAQKYTFLTANGTIIASAIQTYVDILVQMLKNGDDDEESESVTSLSSER